MTRSHAEQSPRVVPDHGHSLALAHTHSVKHLRMADHFKTRWLFVESRKQRQESRNTTET